MGISRVVALVAVVVVHIGLIAIFTGSRKVHDERRDEERSIVVVFLPRMPDEERVTPLASEAKANHKSGHHASKPPAIVATPSATESTAITPPLSAVEKTPPPSFIDWSRESQLAATRTIDSLEDVRRRARGFTPLEANDSSAKPAAPKPEFGWSHAQIHRIEPLPEGGTLVWINDRCGLVLNGMVLPFCKLGTIKTRGDLLEHMNDAPEPGDWKSE